MALFDAVFKQNVIIGVAVGVGVGVGLAVLAPSLFPQAARAARPLAKRVVRSALQVYMRSREGLAEFSEYAEDIIAEAAAEAVQERQAAAAATFAEGAAAAAEAAAATKP